MSQRRRPLVAGNWKMNGLKGSIQHAVRIAQEVSSGGYAADVVLCPPATLLSEISWRLKGSSVAVGAQDCHFLQSGAKTGELSAEMLADVGARFVIVGHSERRLDHGETDYLVSLKADAAVRAGLMPIICVGETAAQRECGQAIETITRQIEASLSASLDGSAFVVAYEPCWAIGTGLTPTLAHIESVHRAIRALLASRYGATGPCSQILYGGSVKPDNAGDILALDNVGGALVGGASLEPADFMEIVAAAAASGAA
jgi:triosephosphate isomerase